MIGVGSNLKVQQYAIQLVNRRESSLRRERHEITTASLHLFSPCVATRKGEGPAAGDCRTVLNESSPVYHSNVLAGVFRRGGQEVK